MPQFQTRSTEQIVTLLPDGLTLMTPNLLSTSQCAVVAGTSDELFNSLKEVVAGNVPIESGGKKVLASPFSMGEEEFLEEDLEITIKLFYLNPTQPAEPEYIRSALEATLAKLGIRQANLLVVAFHGIYLQDESDDLSKAEKVQPPNLQQILAVWKVMEDLHSEGKVSELGVSEFSKQMLIDLLENAKIFPSANQINLSDCCVIPRSLRDFAKSKDIKLFTHSDPNDLVPAESFLQIISNNTKLNGFSDTKYQPQWASRFSTSIKSRGIVTSRGYIVHAS